MRNILIQNYGFVDNEYLDLYLNLIANPPHRNSTYIEGHHVIPVAYYKEKYGVDTRSHRHEADRYANSDENNSIVFLSFADHCKAHWLLANCTTGKLRSANINYLQLTLGGLQKIDKQLWLKRRKGFILSGLTEAEYEMLQQQVDKLKSLDPRFWTADQIKWLQENRQKYNLAELAEQLGKSRNAVHSQLAKLGIKKIWHTDEENIALLEYSKTHTAKECAERFNVSKASIIKRWRELGFKKHTFVWTPEKDAWLRENDSKYTVAELADLLGTTKTTVMGRRWTLGITRWERNNS